MRNGHEGVGRQVGLGVLAVGDEGHGAGVVRGVPRAGLEQGSGVEVATHGRSHDEHEEHRDDAEEHTHGRDGTARARGGAAVPRVVEARCPGVRRVRSVGDRGTPCRADAVPRASAVRTRGPGAGHDGSRDPHGPGARTVARAARPGGRHGRRDAAARRGGRAAPGPARPGDPGRHPGSRGGQHDGPGERAGSRTGTSTDAACPERADALQYELGHGPCVDAVLEDTANISGDVAADQRWGQWGPRVTADLGVRSVLAYRLGSSVSTRPSPASTSTRPG